MKCWRELILPLQRGVHDASAEPDEAVIGVHFTSRNGDSGATRRGPLLIAVLA